VQCLYCSRVIGAIRLLRDREFCCPAHRRKYGDRLGKALHQLTEDEPPPAAMADFAQTMLVQVGSPTCSTGEWMTHSSFSETQTFAGWPETGFQFRLPGFAMAIVTPAEEPQATVEAAPRVCHGWARSPQADPVFSLVRPVFQLIPASPGEGRLDLLAPPAKKKPRVPNILNSWMPVPAPEAVAAYVQPLPALASLAHAVAEQGSPMVRAELNPLPVVKAGPQIPAATRPAAAPGPEPVASFVQSSAATASLMAGAQSPQLPILRAEIEPFPVPDVEEITPAPCTQYGPAPAAEPVFTFVQPAAAVGTLVSGARAPQSLPVAHQVQTPRLATCTNPVPAPAPEPAAAFVQSSTTLALVSCAAHVPQLPALTMGVETPEYDFDDIIPDACTEPARALLAEPVWAFVQPAAAGTSIPVAVRVPEMAALHVAGPYIPQAGNFRRIPAAEPVMAGVWPRIAQIPFDPIAPDAPVTLPDVSAMPIPVVQPQPTPAVPAAAAEAVESPVFATQSALPLAIETPACALPQIAAAGPIPAGAPKLAAHLAGPAPEALESLLTASVAGQIKSATVVRLQPFAVAASEGRTVPGFDAPRLAPPASRPPAAPANLVVFPVSTIRVAPPTLEPQQPTTNIPQPGMVALEFHTQRVRGEAISRLDYHPVRFTPLPPRFSLRPVWEKTEQVAQKPQPQKSTVADVFTMPEAKPKRSQWIGYAAKIAAGIVVVFATWYGASAIKVRSLQVGTDLRSSAPAAPSVAIPGSAGSAVASAAKPETGGALTRVRQTIARRAAVQISDNMREGMEAWGAAAKSYPAGWSRNAEGYVTPGTLALFGPTKTFTDYRLEFFGQIENKGMGVTIRSKDEKNYHAMKLNVIQAGLRPVIALVHYNVVDGKPGHKLQTPLNVMMHSHRPFQVAVNVRGNHFTTSIDGEEVDSYSDDTPSTGGVGFFSETGEKARLYWVKVSKNDDWLGHICAFLSGVNASPASAELWAPELPGSPAPWNPATDRASLAGAWIAFPYVHAARRARNSKSRRNQEWNS